MKKILLLLLIMIFPLNVYASVFDVPGTDIVIQIDEEEWRVLTREDIKDELLLEEYGLDYNEMNSLFNDNNIYMNALTYWDGNYDNYVELFISKTKIDGEIDNFSKLTEEVQEEFANSLAAESGATKFDFYKNDNNTYVYYEFYENELYAANYFTIFNGYNYSIMFQTNVEIDDGIREVYDEMVDNILFYDEADEEKDNTNINRIINLIIISPLLIFLGVKIGSVLKNKN